MIVKGIVTELKKTEEAISFLLEEPNGEKVIGIIDEVTAAKLVEEDNNAYKSLKNNEEVCVFGAFSRVSGVRGGVLINHFIISGMYED